MKKFLVAALAAFTVVSCQNDEILDSESNQENEVKEVANLNKVDDSTAEVIVVTPSDVYVKNGLKVAFPEGLYFKDFKVTSTKNSISETYRIVNGVYYYRIDVDLNKGCGGNYIYLWYAITMDKSEAVTGIRGVVYQTNVTNETFPNEYVRVTDFNGNWIDLNEKAGGRWIHFLQTKKSSFVPLRGVVFSTKYQYVKGTSSYTANGITYTAMGSNAYSYYPMNLNEGTLGYPIYLWYLRY